MIYIFILSIISQIFILYAYSLGAKNAIKEKTTTPLEDVTNRVKKSVDNYKESKEIKQLENEANEEIEKLNIITENINNYDPRGLRQKDV